MVIIYYFPNWTFIPKYINFHSILILERGFLYKHPAMHRKWSYACKERKTSSFPESFLNRFNGHLCPIERFPRHPVQPENSLSWKYITDQVAPDRSREIDKQSLFYLTSLHNILFYTFKSIGNPETNRSESWLYCKIMKWSNEENYAF